MDIATLLIAGLAKGSLYALAALALVLIYKTQDVVNFAFGEIFMFGAFSGYISLKILALPYWLSFALAIVSIGFFGALIERLAFRRVAHMPHLTLAMVTVGLSFAMKGAARIPFGSDIYTFPPIFPDEPIRWAGVVVAPQSLATIVVAVAVTGAFFLFFRRSSARQADARDTAEHDRRAAGWRQREQGVLRDLGALRRGRRRGGCPRSAERAGLSRHGRDLSAQGFRRRGARRTSTASRGRSSADFSSASSRCWSADSCRPHFRMFRPSSSSCWCCS